MAITSSFLQSCLDDAWDAAKVASPTTPDLRAQLRANEKIARTVVSAGSLSSSTSNGHVAEFADYGAGQVTSAEVAEAWRTLINAYDSAIAWIQWCFNYGLDPQTTDPRRQSWPALVQSPATAKAADAYEWLMGSVAVSGSTRQWNGILTPIREVRSDYGDLRIASGMQFT